VPLRQGLGRHAGLPLDHCRSVRGWVANLHLECKIAKTGSISIHSSVRLCPCRILDNQIFTMKFRNGIPIFHGTPAAHHPSIAAFPKCGNQIYRNRYKPVKFITTAQFNIAEGTRRCGTGEGRRRNRKTEPRPFHHPRAWSRPCVNPGSAVRFFFRRAR
jgi:hypothetical protein